MAPSGRVTVEALGQVDRATLAAASRALRAAYRLPATVSAGRRNFARNAYRRTRDQYDADVLLDRLWARAPSQNGCLVTLTNAGIYVPGFNFLFGLSFIGGHAALVSIDALRDGAPAARVRERVTKIAVHEAGHALGLGHCTEPRCVMVYSDTVSRLDRETIRLGPRCRRKLRALIAA